MGQPRKSSKRSYRQHCSLALALDYVGERWTLLIVRQLLLGPQRFTDLQSGLPGIGTNLLAARLKDLEAAGIVRRGTLPPPAASAVYELSELGRGLEPAVVALAGWGLRLLAEGREERTYQPVWAAVAMKATFRPSEARGVRESYEYRIDDDIFHARVDDGRVETGQGPAPGEAAFVLIASTDAFLALATGEILPDDGLVDGSLELRGNREALDRSLRIFGLADPAASPAE